MADFSEISSVPTIPSSSGAALPGKHSIVSALTRPTYTFDGTNYGSWSTAFLEFLNAHQLQHHLTDPPPRESDPTYAEWSSLESAVCTWMCQSVANDIIEPISQTRPARALWQKLATMYANKSNVSRTVRLYEDLFACKQGTQTLQSYYGAIEAIFTNLAIYQPTLTDPETLARYKDELRAGAFLSGLRPELADMIRGQVLGGARVMTVEEIFAAALRVQDSLPPSSISPTSEVSALVVSGGPSKASGKGSSSGKPRNSFPPCKYCGKTSHPAEKCWKEFGKPAWVLAATGRKQFSTSTSAHTPSVPTSVVSLASVPPGSLQIAVSPSELAYLQASRASAMHTPPWASTSLASLASSLASYTGGNASTPGTSALTASHDISWVIDSGASAI